MALIFEGDWNKLASPPPHNMTNSEHVQWSLLNIDRTVPGGDSTVTRYRGKSPHNYIIRARLGSIMPCNKSNLVARITEESSPKTHHPHPTLLFHVFWWTNITSRNSEILKTLKLTGDSALVEDMNMFWFIPRLCCLSSFSVSSDVSYLLFQVAIQLSPLVLQTTYRD